MIRRRPGQKLWARCRHCNRRRIGRRSHPHRSVGEFQNRVRSSAAAIADSAQEFIKRFPTDEKAADARYFIVYGLCQAIAAGDSNAETRVEQYVSAVLADASIPEDQRTGVFLQATRVAFVKRVGMRIFTDRADNKLSEEEDAALITSLRATLKRFPKSTFPYTTLCRSRSAPRANDKRS